MLRPVTKNSNPSSQTTTTTSRSLRSHFCFFHTLARPGVHVEKMAGSGTVSRLPTAVLAVSGVCTVVAVLVSMMSIHLHLRNYRKPALQRCVGVHFILGNGFLIGLYCSMVVRIMVMVPLYAIASLISLFSVEAAFVIDAIRDIYEVSFRSSGW